MILYKLRLFYNQISLTTVLSDRLHNLHDEVKVYWHLYRASYKYLHIIISYNVVYHYTWSDVVFRLVMLPAI